MNVDEILRALNDEQVDYLLIGGMNFLLRHLPELTFDVDVWVRDEPANLERVNRALRRLGAEWGATDKEWRPVPADWNWLKRQGCFCMTTKHGALDVFREVRGLEGRYDECCDAAVPFATNEDVSYLALSDEHARMPAGIAGQRPQAKADRSSAPGHSTASEVMNSNEQKFAEERKRDANYDPVLRWKHIQETITWAEANLPRHLQRNRPENRIAEERRKNVRRD